MSFAIWRVRGRSCFFLFYFNTAAACSGSSIALLGNRVGWWSFDTRRFDWVRAAGGTASSAATAFLDRVFVDGGSGGKGGPSLFAAWRCRRFFRFLLADVSVTWICSALCLGAVVCTLGSDCCRALFVVMDCVICLVSLISLSTLGTGCATLGDGCIGDVVGVKMGNLISTSLSNLRRSWLSSL